MIEIVIGFVIAVFFIALCLKIGQYFKLNKLKKAELRFKESEWKRYAEQYKNNSHYENGVLIPYKKALNLGLVPLYIRTKQGIIAKNKKGEYVKMSSKEYTDTYSTFLFPLYVDTSSGTIGCSLGGDFGGGDSGGGFGGGDCGGGDGGGGF